MTTPHSTTEAGVTEADALLLRHGTTGKRQVWFQRAEVLAIVNDLAQSRQASAQGGERVEPPSDDDIVALARVASSENHYAGGRCVRMEFTPSNIVTFARSLATPPATSGMKESLVGDAERLTPDEAEAVLHSLSEDHGGDYFEPECPGCTAYRKLAAIRAGMEGVRR